MALLKEGDFVGAAVSIYQSLDDSNHVYDDCEAYVLAAFGWIMMDAPIRASADVSLVMRASLMLSADDRPFASHRPGQRWTCTTTCLASILARHSRTVELLSSSLTPLLPVQTATSVPRKRFCPPTSHVTLRRALRHRRRKPQPPCLWVPLRKLSSMQVCQSEREARRRQQGGKEQRNDHRCAPPVSTYAIMPPHSSKADSTTTKIA